MFDALVNITEFLWGTPLMILMVGVGLYLSARTGFFQIFHRFCGVSRFEIV